MSGWAEKVKSDQLKIMELEYVICVTSILVNTPVAFHYIFMHGIKLVRRRKIMKEQGVTPI